MALGLVLRPDPLPELLLRLGVVRAAHRRQHRRRLLPAHHRDPRVRPHEQQPRRVRPPAHRVVPRPERPADHDRQLRHPGRRHRRHHLRAVLGDPARLVLPADHEPGDVLQEHQRHCRAGRTARRSARPSAPTRRTGSRCSPRCPPGWPWMRAKPVTSVGPYRALNSWNRDPSTIRAITSRTSYGIRGSVGTTPYSSVGSTTRLDGRRDVPRRGARAARGSRRSTGRCAARARRRRPGGR